MNDSLFSFSASSLKFFVFNFLDFFKKRENLTREGYQSKSRTVIVVTLLINYKFIGNKTTHIEHYVLLESSSAVTQCIMFDVE
jgi:hypothetical protein